MLPRTLGLLASTLIILVLQSTPRDFLCCLCSVFSSISVSCFDHPHHLSTLIRRVLLLLLIFPSHPIQFPVS
ncbi:hypothetical protein F5879DRAFT_86117 [Lentinula edodes]|nr:hypothetical protein F5879DRAFT_86117 [Lentinula edodes]